MPGRRRAVSVRTPAPPHSAFTGRRPRRQASPSRWETRFACKCSPVVASRAAARKCASPPVRCAA
jgi:hypothetical protein